MTAITTHDLHRLGELVMDRLLILEAHRLDLSSSSVGTSADTSTMDVAMSLHRGGQWVNWNAMLTVHQDGDYWRVTADCGLNAVGTTLERLADSIVDAVDLLT